MMTACLRVEPLEPAAFAPFGDVLQPPAAAGRRYFDASLRNDRPDVGASLSLSRVELAKALPLTAVQMERHPKSSQSFVPLGPVPFLVLVAPHAAAGGPDMTRARAFLAEGGVGVTYGADVWHHPLTVFGAPAGFAVFMWRDGGPEDEEFVDIEPLTVLPMEPGA
ncbi:MAG: ureidoglycolate hydrolase [Geminicoccaceae bacterium]|nr:MAG: ureidoglycolate hydrolase [Geminicoccaceae bacterium]